MVNGEPLNEIKTDTTDGTFTRDAVWNWQVKVPAALASEDNQQYIKENFGSLPSYINLTKMKGYQTGSNTQKLLTGGSSYGIKNALLDTGAGLFLGSRTKGLSKVSKGKILSADNLRSGGSVALDLIPRVSTLKGIQQALTGVNIVTGKKLSAVDRWAEVGGIAASLIPFPGAKIAGKYATKAVIKGISKATDFIGGLFKKKKPKPAAKIEKDVVVPNNPQFFDRPVAGDNIGINLRGANKGTDNQSLYHYTNEKGVTGILSSNQLNPSLKANNPKDVRYGNGQYLSDIAPETKTPAQLAKQFINVPNKYKYTDFVEIDVRGLDVKKGRDGVYVIPNETPLDLTGRIVGTGKVGRK